MAVFAPMPNARVSTATAVKPGFFSNWRKAKRRSCSVASPKLEPRMSRHSSRTLCTLPKRRRASRAASSGDIPVAMFSAARSSRCKRSSSSMSCFTACPSERSRCQNVLSKFMVLSFVSKRHHRIDFCGAAGGEPAGYQGHQGQQQGDHGKRQRIQSPYFIQLAPQQPGERERSAEANANSSQHEGHSLAEYQHEYLRLARAECHANANFAGLLGHVVGEHAVKANGREKQGHSGETAEQLHGQPFLRNRGSNELGHCLHILKREVFVHACQFDANR